MSAKRRAGVIVAGGRSRRMGEDKASKSFVGEPLLTRLVRRLAPVVDELLVIGPASLESLAPDARVLGDLVSDAGPLGGLYTALHATECEHLFLMACDMPFVEPQLVRAMLAVAASAPADAVAMCVGRRLQPLHAVYPRACLPTVERHLASDDRSLHNLFRELSVITMDDVVVRRNDPHGLSTMNVNTPSDWLAAEQLARSGARASMSAD
jgi:molybdenum cofactor guanylyltransferase